MFMGLESPTHLLFILVVVLLLFGGKRIPELARGLGTGMREFRKGLESDDTQDNGRGREETLEERNEDESRRA